MTTPSTLYSHSTPNFVITYDSVPEDGRSPVKSSSADTLQETAQWIIEKPEDDATGSDRYISPSDADTMLEVDNNLLYVASGTGSPWTMTNQTKPPSGGTFYTITDGTLSWILSPAKEGIQVSLIAEDGAVTDGVTPLFGCITGC